MFASTGLFQNLQCPQNSNGNCPRKNCIFSHRTDLSPPPALHIPVEQPRPTSASSRSSSSATPARTVVPAKRPVTQSPIRASATPLNASPLGEPPRKVQKLGSPQKSASVPSTSYTSTGVPILRVNAALSQVAVPVRQAMVKNLYEHFTVLYNAILPSNPTLASEHALRQEEEVYKKSTKLTYKNAVISSIATLKRRPRPDSISHSSVGTEGDVALREEQKRSMNSLRLTRDHLVPLLLSEDERRKLGYIIDVPDGPGGSKPSEVGNTMKCERCAQPYQVKPQDQVSEECEYHYGKQFTRLINGERTRVYTCCSRPSSDSGGCVRGPHVFYESEPTQLHLRHAFSPTRVPLFSEDSSETALDVAALDCEMVYTTGGMRCARVSVVDGARKEVFDELVKMDEDVEIVDYNTRFSGITAENHSKAVLPLASIRKSLDALINANTILIGHALDNDLKTLRMIHGQCVDTVMLFPHRAGHPYRRALKDLVKEHLGTVIQAGGELGHSSVEDSIATLDLVRWYVVNKPKPRKTISSDAGRRRGDSSNTSDNAMVS